MPSWLLSDRVATAGCLWTVFLSAHELLVRLVTILWTVLKSLVELCSNLSRLLGELADSAGITWKFWAFLAVYMTLCQAPTLPFCLRLSYM
jgi:hypothetical protein